MEDVGSYTLLDLHLLYKEILKLYKCQRLTKIFYLLFCFRNQLYLEILDTYLQLLGRTFEIIFVDLKK